MKVAELFGSEEVDWSCSNSVIQDQNLSQICNTLKQAQRYKYARSGRITYTSGYEVISYEKIRRRYTIKLSHITLRFRENRVQKFVE